MRRGNAKAIRLGIELARKFNLYQGLGLRLSAVKLHRRAMSQGNLTYRAFERTRLKAR